MIQQPRRVAGWGDRSEPEFRQRLRPGAVFFAGQGFGSLMAPWNEGGRCRMSETARTRLAVTSVTVRVLAVGVVIALAMGELYGCLLSRLTDRNVGADHVVFDTDPPRYSREYACARDTHSKLTFVLGEIDESLAVVWELPGHLRAVDGTETD